MEHVRYFVSINEKGIANVYTLRDFNKDGYLLNEFGEPTKFHLNDFQHKLYFEDFDDAWVYAKEHNEK